MADPTADWPSVSVVVPARDAAGTLDATLESICGQEYPGDLDVVVAVGPSSDGTAGVVRAWSARDPRVRLVDNPAGTTPAGLNRAIEASTGQVVTRVDAHAVLAPGYVRRAVQVLDETGADNVGGIQDPVGETEFEQAVAAAMRTWLGSGGAAYRRAGEPGPVDTVYLGVFRRSALERVGGYDETLVRNQDYELNIRLRAAGGTVWLDPQLRVRYRPRATLRGLARQYFEYGRWKREVLRRHPGSARARQLGPPLALLAVLLGIATGPVTRGRSLVVPGAYAVVVTVGGLTVRDLPPGARLRLPVAVGVMHGAWAVGFLRG